MVISYLLLVFLKFICSCVCVLVFLVLSIMFLLNVGWFMCWLSFIGSVFFSDVDVVLW